MSGRGLLSEAPINALSPDKRIWLFGNDGNWRQAAEPVDSPIGQIDKVSSDDAGVGPGLAFAKALLAHDAGRRIGLVPCAKGGSAIGEWRPAFARTTLYGSCLARARDAARRGTIAGILWYQGESDTTDQLSAGKWPAKFREMIEPFRKALKQSDLPVVIVGLGDQPLTGPFAGRFHAWQAVQDAQRNLHLPRQGYVSAAGLARNPDQLHLTTVSQIRLGQMMAAQMTIIRR